MTCKHMIGWAVIAAVVMVGVRAWLDDRRSWRDFHAATARWSTT